MEVNQPVMKTVEETATYGKFVVEPLERGYGVTLGNSLRRVMLSSIKGAAITRVRIQGVLHEFAIIPGLKEDATSLLLNLKDVCVRVEPGLANRPHKLRLSRRGIGRVTGADIECPDGVTVVNPEVYLAEIADENASLEMEMDVEVGRGYVLPDEKRSAEQPIGTIPLAAAFTPVRKVNYTVEPRRLGFRTDLEGLVLDVVTNGTIRPSAAVSQAAAILNEFFQQFMQLAPEEARLPGAEGAPEHELDDTPVSELGFRQRTMNGLLRANIRTLGQLRRTSDKELLSIRNFGNKSLEEVHSKLQELGFTLAAEATEAEQVPAEEEEIEGGEEE